MIMNYNLKENMRFHFVLKIITIVILIWIYDPYDYKCDFDRTLEKKSKHDSIIDIGFNRLLSQYEYKKQLNYTSLSKNLPSHSKFKDIKNEKNISTYGHLKKGKENELDAYKKNYKYRYGKKKGLAKLDCYYEKKIFNKIDEIYELSRSMQNDEKNFKKKIYNIFGYRLILFVMSPIIGVIFPILFSKNGPLYHYCPNDCGGSDGEHNHENVVGPCRRTPLDSTQWDIISSFHSLIFFSLLIIVLTVIIYTLVKVVKYERLKAGKGKIKGKAYYRFC
ncbi:hypothetical protein PVNG_04485 [Plasmodium vivax North Korean]|uniref:Variable surface protein Vir35 n=1 Tax=Plasmodium vivax North Korean TaxID=1035514 RepID=A0A0J9WFE2_PLAVI|nr:hypothetical protein PVNG_04485 [Plasmodium vivax North Korean]